MKKYNFVHNGYTAETVSKGGRKLKKRRKGQFQQSYLLASSTHRSSPKPADIQITAGTVKEKTSHITHLGGIYKKSKRLQEESMLDWKGNMRNERDHEKRVVLEDNPSDETMISSLALCVKEEEIISYNFVGDQDDNASTVQGFEDEMQFYQAMKLRTEHGQFAMNVGATSMLDQVYMDDDDSQGSNDDDENSMDDPEDDF